MNPALSETQAVNLLTTPKKPSFSANSAGTRFAEKLRVSEISENQLSEAVGGSSMPNFSEKVPRKLSNVVGTVKIDENLSKGVATEYLLHLARLARNIKGKDFGSDQDGTCNLGLKDAQMAIFATFRKDHNPVLDGKGQFFSTALRIGATAYELGYRLSEKKDFEKANLVNPP